jgi:hypothetical protein
VVVESYDELIAAGRKEYLKTKKNKTDEEIYDHLLLTIGPKKFYEVLLLMRELDIESISIEELAETIKAMKREKKKTKALLDKITSLETNKPDSHA